MLLTLHSCSSKPTERKTYIVSYSLKLLIDLERETLAVSSHTDGYLLCVSQVKEPSSSQSNLRLEKLDIQECNPALEKGNNARS